MQNSFYTANKVLNHSQKKNIYILNDNKTSFSNFIIIIIIIITIIIISSKNLNANKKGT